MSIDLITKNGTKIGQLSDSLNGEDDFIIVKGKKVRLSDAYDSKDIRDAFASELEELNNAINTNKSSEDSLQ